MSQVTFYVPNVYIIKIKRQKELLFSLLPNRSMFPLLIFMANSGKAFLDIFIKTIKINFQQSLWFLYGSYFNLSVTSSEQSVLYPWMRVIATHTPVMVCYLLVDRLIFNTRNPGHVQSHGILDIYNHMEILSMHACPNLSAFIWPRSHAELGLVCFVRTAVPLPPRNSAWHKVGAQEIWKYKWIVQYECPLLRSNNTNYCFSEDFTSLLPTSINYWSVYFPHLLIH